VVGRHVILNTASTVDHDCRIGDFVHIAPGAILCGQASVGEGTLVGAGATILPGVTVGKWCVIGAGAVVHRPIPDFSLAVGVPVRVVSSLPR
jgi:acetyltransferase-like isoleucine patch superfamily enzyme